MDFPARLAALRKQKGLTQKALGEAVDMSLIQISRYENGSSQPTLDVIPKLAVTLSASVDNLVFGENERGPDNELRLEFEAISRFNLDEKKTAYPLGDFSGDHLDIHQALLRWTPQSAAWFSATVGRQRTAYGGQRLLGAVDWAQQARAFDGARIDLTSDRAGVRTRSRTRPVRCTSGTVGCWGRTAR